MKYAIYRLLPSWSKTLHGKRRKGWARGAEHEFPALHGQQLQDHVFFEKILRGRKSGIFWELGAGDGVVGLHSLSLELKHGWRGLLVEPQPRPIPLRLLRSRRTAEFLDAGPAEFPGKMRETGHTHALPDFVACHSAAWNEAVVQAALFGAFRPRIIILHLPISDPAWAQRLAPAYRLAFAYHDDEYYVAHAAP